MLIDWFTLCAQIINFLILIWLLRRFFYKPVMEAMQKREEKIKASFEEAEQKRLEAAEQEELIQARLAEVDQERRELIASLKQEIYEKKREMLEQLRDEVDQLKSNWLSSLDHEKESFKSEVARRSQQEIIDTIASALRDLSDESLEQAIAGKFVNKLHSLNDEKSAELVREIERSKDPVVVRSAFELSDFARKSIEQELKDLGLQAGASFEESKDLICGIELMAGGQKISWNIESYLESLKLSIEESLNGKRTE